MSSTTSPVSLGPPTHRASLHRRDDGFPELSVSSINSSYSNHLHCVEEDDEVKSLTSSDSSQGAQPTSSAFPSMNELDQEPIHIGILRNVVAAFESGQERDGLSHARALLRASPETANRIFGKIWVLAGSPTHRTQPAIAHKSFGKVAFFNEAGRSVPMQYKVDAVRAVLGELAPTPSLESVYGSSPAQSSPRVSEDLDVSLLNRTGLERILALKPSTMEEAQGIFDQLVAEHGHKPNLSLVRAAFAEEVESIRAIKASAEEVQLHRPAAYCVPLRLVLMTEARAIETSAKYLLDTMGKFDESQPEQIEAFLRTEMAHEDYLGSWDVEVAKEEVHVMNDVADAILGDLLGDLVKELDAIDAKKQKRRAVAREIEPTTTSESAMKNREAIDAATDSLFRELLGDLPSASDAMQGRQDARRATALTQSLDTSKKI